ncbi:MAG: YafY family transcriptional regulator [Caldilineaceae bacterium]|nr:YafY family transcriptional regulator [Caldilineaceae bacterium]
MRADRLISIVMLLQSRGKLTTQTLAQELEVSRRTILRDIEALSMAGIPIYTDGGHGGGVALDENYRTTLTGLSEAEVQALFVASNNSLLQEIGLGEAEQTTRRKLTAALPAMYQPSVEHIRQRIYIDPLWWWHDANPLPFWEELQQAVYEDCCIQVIYENYGGAVSERILEPYSLVAKSSNWYLVARQVNGETGELRIFRVTRLQKLNLLEIHFRRDPHFDLVTYWREHLDQFISAFSEYECTLRIRPERLNWVRWLVPGRNTLLEEDAEGWLTVRLQLDNEELAKMLVFGLGAAGQVVEPATLKEHVQGACRRLLDHMAVAQHGERVEKAP